MKTIFLVANLFVGLHAFAGGIVSGGFDDKGIEIVFGNTGVGIDQTSKDLILDLVKDDLGSGQIKLATSTITGFEGEMVFCVEFPDSTIMSRRFDAYDAIVKTSKGLVAHTTPSCSLK